MSDDGSDSDEEFSLYTEGIWTWSDMIGQLDFVKYKKFKKKGVETKIVVNNIKFNDDIGPLELARFSKYFRRKSKEQGPDVITLQDVKDFVLFTAPSEILNKKLIHIFHTPQTERYLRSLILYTQYFLQCKDIMKERIEELSYKIRTVEAQQYDDVLAENLRELRLILGRQYVFIILGIDTYAQYHHMGRNKRLKSLSKKDINFYECFLQICIQIVYVALLRRDYEDINSEINRVLKTESFGQTMKTHGERVPLKPILPLPVKLERAVLRGKIYTERNVINHNCPLVEEIKVQRPNTDCRLIHAGHLVLAGPPSPRLIFYQRMLASSEESLNRSEDFLGILGMFRENFDTSLKMIPTTVVSDSKKSRVDNQSKSLSSKVDNQSKGEPSKTMQVSRSTKQHAAKKKVLELLKIPDCSPLFLMDELSTVPLHLPPCDKAQKKRWIKHLNRFNRRMSRKQAAL